MPSIAEENEYAKTIGKKESLCEYNIVAGMTRRSLNTSKHFINDEARRCCSREKSLSYYTVSFRF